MIVVKLSLLRVPALNIGPHLIPSSAVSSRRPPSIHVSTIGRDPRRLTLLQTLRRRHNVNSFAIKQIHNLFAKHPEWGYLCDNSAPSAPQRYHFAVLLGEPTHPFSRRSVCAPLSTFRINTCKSVSKQRTLTPFRMNSCEKPRGGGGYC